MMAAINTATSESRRGRQSPWNQVVRGGESDPEPSPPPTPPPPAIAEDSSGDGGKRLAWNKQPANGGSEAPLPPPVMGAESWPALGESARVSTKLSSESLKGLSEGVASASSSQVQVAGTTVSTVTLSPRKQAPSASAPNQPAPVRQKSMKQRNNPNASSNGAPPQQQEVAAGQVYENVASNPSPSPRDNAQRSGFGHHSSHGGGDSQNRNSFRNRNGSGPHVRGEGPHHHNSYGGRREQDRGNQEWSSHNRSFNGRDSHIQQQRMPRPVRGPPPPPSPPPFIPHLGMRPYGPPPPMTFPAGELGGVYYLHPPFVAPVPPILVHGPDPQLPSKIVNQIDYYFSNENLVKDEYLRKKMNKDGGWVPIDFIARFQKVSVLTDNIPFILDALRLARNVEVQGDQIRRRSDWQRWIIASDDDSVKAQRSQTTVKSSDEYLAARLQGVALEERNMNTSSSSGGQSTQFLNGDAGSDHSVSGRN